MSALRADAAQWAIAAAVASLPPLVWFLLRGGAGGAFLFDDIVNLRALDHFGGSVETWQELREYLSLNMAGPTGRPIAMLSFLLQQHEWPAAARAMIEFNLLLHSLTGLVLALITFRLARRVTGVSVPAAGAVAVLAAAIWLLHPLQASTVFYIIQRMAQLSTLFVLLGVLSYILGREALDAGRTTRAAFWLLLTPVIGAIGLYAKENAVLLPLALLVTEHVFFREPGRYPRIRTGLRLAYCWLPALVIAGYLVAAFWGAGYEHRPFTAGERLATQAQALPYYLYLLAVPQSLTPGIYYDAFPVAGSWLSPPVISGLVIIAVAITLAIRFRREAPLAAWGVLFFFAMHALESTSRALELYFEHRNYLPSAGLAVAFAAGLVALFRHYRIAGTTAIVLWLALSSAQAHIRAENWGNPQLLAELWVTESPDSPRAWLNFARRAALVGDTAGVAHAYERWQELSPDSVTRVASSLAVRCPQQPLHPEEVAALRTQFASGHTEPGIVQAMAELAGGAVDGRCPGLRIEVVHSLIRTLLDNPHVQRDSTRQRLWNLTGQIMLSAGFVEEALDAYGNSQEIRRNDLLLIMQTIRLAEQGHEREALDHLERFRDNEAQPIHHRLHIYWLLMPIETYFDDLAEGLREVVHAEEHAARTRPLQY